MVEGARVLYGVSFIKAIISFINLFTVREYVCVLRKILKFCTYGNQELDLD